MAIKKKVTYSVSYVAGTDTLTTKLNSLLDDIVSLIVGHNSGLSIIDRITVGSTRFTGAPLYDTYVAGLDSDYFNNRHYESDVVFLGTDEDNVCLSLGFFQGHLVVAMNMAPAVEQLYVDAWSSYGLSNFVPLYATGRSSRWFTSSDQVLGQCVTPYVITDDTITMSVVYWTGSYSSGYSFVNGAGQTVGVGLVIYKTAESDSSAGIGAGIYGYNTMIYNRAQYVNCLTVFSFSENLSEHMASAISSRSYPYDAPPVPSDAQQVILNGYNDWRIWYHGRNDSYATPAHALFQSFHTLGGAGGNTGDDYSGVSAIQHFSAVDGAGGGNTSAMASAYNLPYLSTGQAYVRKMRIPGWNPNCKGEIYLLWSPVLTGYTPGDILEIGNKQYAIITPGAVCWAARVA